MRNDTSSGNGGFDKHIQLLVAPDSQLQVPGGDSPNLEVLAGVSSQLEHFGSEVLQDGRSVDRRGRPHTLFSTDTCFQETVDTTHWELKTRTVRTRLRRFFWFSSTYFSTFSAFSAFSDCHFFIFYCLNNCNIIYLIQFKYAFWLAYI